ncbi:MAG: hypothetical protein ACYS80_15010 [Planctomycetota bacterium]
MQPQTADIRTEPPGNILVAYGISRYTFGHGCGMTLRITGASPVDLVDELFELLVEISNGMPTASEHNRCREFAINRIGPTF